jgi:D,D-heptose 1,7-bisphosphate phosphatase
LNILFKFFSHFKKNEFSDSVLLLDRDGTINVNTGYISNPAEIQLEQGCEEGLNKLKSYGVKFVVISNQSGIGRGFIDPQDLLLIHNKIDYLLQNNYEDLYIEKYIYCPHHPRENCSCRKPKLGLYKQFKKDYKNNRVLAIVGDKYSDIKMLTKYKIPSILVRTGYGAETEEKIKNGKLKRPIWLAYIADNLLDASDFILSGRLQNFKSKKLKEIQKSKAKKSNMKKRIRKKPRPKK